MYGTTDSVGRDSNFSRVTFIRCRSVCETWVEEMVADHSPIHIYSGSRTVAWICSRNSDCASASETGVRVLHHWKHDAGNNSFAGRQWNQQRCKRDWWTRFARQQALGKPHD